MKNAILVILCLLLPVVMSTGCASTGANGTAVEATKVGDNAGVKLMVLYPQPTDIAQFDKDYREHLSLLHEKANIPDNVPPPYTVTRFNPTPDGPADYYQLFTMPFPSAEALQQAVSTAGMQEVAADAVRISSGGPPVVLIGSEVP